MRKKIYNIASIFIIILSLFYLTVIFIYGNDTVDIGTAILMLSSSIILSVFLLGAIYQLLRKK